VSLVVPPFETLRTAHDRGEVSAGLDVFSGGVVDTVDAGVVEPVHAKRQVLDSATEAANLVLRIDAIISAGDLSEILGRDEELREGENQSVDVSGGTN
jgi:chaperonin GroEL (HSP60 family)